MQLIQDLLLQLSDLINPYRSQIALIINATLLVIYGDVVNKFIKKHIASFHFVLRTLVFVAICSFGYGLVVLWLAPFTEHLLAFPAKLYQGLLVVAVFLLLGYLAEHRRYI